MTSRTVIPIALLATVLALAHPIRASAQDVLSPVAEVANWRPWGAPATLARDANVPGRDSLRLAPRGVPGDPWSSGAGLTLAAPLKVGEQVTAVFWARAERPMRMSVTIQGGAPNYASIVASEVALTTAWRPYAITGTASADLPAGSQSLTVQTGRAAAAVTLGPVAFMPGRPSPAAATRAFSGFQPTQVVEDVRIPSGPGVVLAGTLRTPTGHGPGPFPLAIMIQGHGPNGRGGFDVLMRRLLADGIATLDYDKRGIGASTGVYKEDPERLTADAASVVAAMRGRKDINGARIALVGHSQGGIIAPAAAAADPTIAAVVMLAGSVGDGLPYLQRAIHSQLIAAGLPEAKAAPAVAAVTKLLQARIDRANAETIAPLRAAVVDQFEAAGFSPPQAQGALAMIDTEEAWNVNKLHSASDLHQLRVPVLAVFGTKDPMVVAAEEAPAARAALAGNPNGKVVVLEGLSHWFKDGAKTGSAAENDTLGPNLGSPRLVTLTTDWLRDVLGPSPAAVQPATRSE